VTLNQRCGIPGCRQQQLEGHDLCEDHFQLGYGPDYRAYRDLIAEGYPSHQAAVMTGLKDPDE